MGLENQLEIELGKELEKIRGRVEEIIDYSHGLSIFILIITEDNFNGSKFIYYLLIA
jgi:hypothetical protein